MGKNLTKQQQQTIVLIVMFVFGGGYAYINYMMKPTNERIQKAEAKLTDLRTRIERAERQSRRLPALEAEYEQLQRDLADLEKQLPKDQNVPNIIRTLTDEANRENMVFTRLAPRKTTRQNYFEIIPFDLQFKGSLHSLARFLAALGQQERIFKAEDITLTPIGGDLQTLGVPLSIQLAIQTYAYRG